MIPDNDNPNLQVGQLSKEVLLSYRRNDPKQTHVTIPPTVLEEDTLKQLGESLLNNTIVTSLEIHLNGLLNNCALRPLLQFIEHSSSLQSVSLTGYCCNLHQTYKVMMRLYHAMNVNRSISILKLYKTELSAHTLAVFLSNTASLTCLEVRNCHIERSLGRGMPELAQAFGQNSSLQQLVLLDNDLSDAFCVPILAALSQQSQECQLQQLTISKFQRVEVLQQFLEDAASLEHLELHSFSFVGPRVELNNAIVEQQQNNNNEDSTTAAFHAIYKGIRKNSALTKLSFACCQLDDSAMISLEKCFTSSEKNLNTLVIGSGNSFQFGMLTMNKLLQNILQHPNHTLRNLVLSAGCQDVSSRRLARIFRALNGIHTLKIVHMDGIAHWKAFMDSLPYFETVQHLELDMTDRTLASSIKDDLLLSFQKNTSLHSIDIKYQFDDQPQHEEIELDDHELNMFCQRNKVLPELLKSASVSNSGLSLWPKLLESSVQSPTMMSQIFATLMWDHHEHGHWEKCRIMPQM